MLREKHATHLTKHYPRQMEYKITLKNINCINKD